MTAFYIYIGDGDIYLPCQYNEMLNKRYPSMPMLYAVIRHLYKSNIHVNVQALGRIWDKLREQADRFIKCVKTVDKGEYLEVHAISYDKYESALRGLLPNKNSQYVATHGEIVLRRFRVLKSEIEYDTRHFKSVFLNETKNETRGLIGDIIGDE